MRTCPHMSPGCSSPWDLNIAPARHYCCHSQAHSDLLTSPAQKRLDADTFTANVFHQSEKRRAKERQKDRKTERQERQRDRKTEREESSGAQFEDVPSERLFFPLSPKNRLTFAVID